MHHSVVGSCLLLLFSCAGDRSNDFIVGLTNVSPVESAPVMGSYTLCGQYPGAVPNGATVSVHCALGQPPFRYVIIHIPRKVNLNFCEVQVVVPGLKNVNVSDVYRTYHICVFVATFYRPRIDVFVAGSCRRLWALLSFWHDVVCVVFLLENKYIRTYIQRAGQRSCLIVTAQLFMHLGSVVLRSGQ